MAEERESIIIDVQFDDAETKKKLKEVQTAMRELQEQNGSLKSQMKDLDRTTEEGAEAFAKLSTQYAINAQQIKSLKVSEKVLQQAEMDLGVQATITGDSFKEQARQLALMKNAYSQMSKAERESASGQEFLKKLQELDAQVKANDASMGNFQRNVGNYPKIFDLTNTSIGKLVTSFYAFGAQMAAAKAQSQGMGEQLRLTQAQSKGMGEQLRLTQGQIQGMGVEALTTKEYFTGAVTQMTAGVKTLGKAFLTPPVVVIAVVVGGLILLFEKLKEAFKKNDAAMTTLQKAFASFEPIIQAVNAMVMKMVEGIAAAVGWIGKMVAVLADWATGSEGAADAARDLVQAEDDLQQKEREYTENSAKRNAEVSELRAKAAEKDKYTAKERQDMLQQAIDLEKQNLADEKAIAAERVRILEARAEQEMDTSDETQDKIAEAKAAMYRAEQNYNDGTRRLLAGLTAARQEEANESKRIATEAAEERKRIADAEAAAEAERLRAETQAAAEAAETRKQIMQEYEDFLISQIEGETERRTAQIELQGQREAEAMRERLANLAETETEARAQLQAMIEAKEQETAQKIADVWAEADAKDAERRLRKIETDKEIAVLQAESDDEARAIQIEAKRQEAEELKMLDAETKAALFQSEDDYRLKVAQTEAEITRLQKEQVAQRRANAQASASAVAGALGSLGQLIDAFDSESKESAKAGKALALAQIAVETGIAIAKGTAQAMSVPFPANIAAIATTVATVVANMASAVSTIKSAKFASGGVVPGDPSKGDVVPAMLTGGEVVLNNDQQARLLYSLAQGNVAGTGGMNYEVMRDAMAEAISGMPAPVMVYKEFNEFTGRTAQYKELATI